MISQVCDTDFLHVFSIFHCSGLVSSGGLFNFIVFSSNFCFITMLLPLKTQDFWEMSLFVSHQKDLIKPVSMHSIPSLWDGSNLSQCTQSLQYELAQTCLNALNPFNMRWNKPFSEDSIPSLLDWRNLSQCTQSLHYEMEQICLDALNPFIIR